MSFEQTLTGTIGVLDRAAKTLRISHEITQDGRCQPASIDFTLSPHVTVIGSHRGALKLTALKTGQRVCVRYVTEPGDRRIANVIVVIEPAGQPQAGFPGVRVRV